MALFYYCCHFIEFFVPLIKILEVITTDKLHTDSIKHHFKNKAIFETKDIFDFYEHFDKDIKPTTINWRVYALVQEGVLQRTGRGKFSLGEGRKYIPEISSVTKSIFKKLKAEFPYANTCVWNTSVLNEFILKAIDTLCLSFKIGSSVLKSSRLISF